MHTLKKLIIVLLFLLVATQTQALPPQTPIEINVGRNNANSDSHGVYDAAHDIIWFPVPDENNVEERKIYGNYVAGYKPVSGVSTVTNLNYAEGFAYQAVMSSVDPLKLYVLISYRLSYSVVIPVSFTVDGSNDITSCTPEAPIILTGSGKSFGNKMAVTSSGGSDVLWITNTSGSDNGLVKYVVNSSQLSLIDTSAICKNLYGIAVVGTNLYCACEDSGIIVEIDSTSTSSQTAISIGGTGNTFDMYYDSAKSPFLWFSACDTAPTDSAAVIGKIRPTTTYSTSQNGYQLYFSPVNTASLSVNIKVCGNYIYLVRELLNPPQFMRLNILTDALDDMTATSFTSYSGATGCVCDNNNNAYVSIYGSESTEDVTPLSIIKIPMQGAL